MISKLFKQLDKRLGLIVAIDTRKMVDLSGQFLMRHGLVLPWAFPDTMWVVEGVRL